MWEQIESSESELEKEDDTAMDQDDYGDGASYSELEQGSSRTNLSFVSEKQSNPTTSTPCSESRSKRRRLLVQPVELGGNFSISETSGRPDSPEDVYNPVSPVVSADESSDRSISPIPGGRGRGRGRGGQGVQDPSQRAGGDPDSSTGTASNSRVTRTPIPYRFPSKDTPTVIDFGSMHPFTEEVGPTRTLPTPATALDTDV